MNKSLFLILFFAIFHLYQAQAYIPPSHYMLQKIAANKKENPQKVIFYSILSPGENSEQSRILWRGGVIYNTKESYEAGNELWPLSALIVENDSNKLLTQMKAFGIPVKSEDELLAFDPVSMLDSEQIPAPFYLKENTLALVRLENQFVWTVSSENQSKILGIEKDTFLPIFMKSPCPQELGESFWGSAKEACELEFSYNSKRVYANLPSIINLYKTKNKIAIIRIDRVISQPNEKILEKITSRDLSKEFESVDPVVVAIYKKILNTSPL